MSRSFGRRLCALAGALCTAAVLLSVTPASAAGLFRYQADCSGSATGTSVDVPSGATTTTITGTNVPISFPNGTTAIANEVITSGGTTTRNALHFLTGPNAGVIVGQVVCGPTTSSATAIPGSGPAVNCPAGTTQPPAGGGSSAGTITVTNVEVSCSAAAGTTPSAFSAGFYTFSGPYPLVVDASAASGATPALGTHSPAGAAPGHSSTGMLIGGGFALAVLAQLTVGRKVWRRRGQATS